MENIETSRMHEIAFRYLIYAASAGHLPSKIPFDSKSYTSNLKVLMDEDWFGYNKIVQFVSDLFKYHTRPEALDFILPPEERYRMAWDIIKVLLVQGDGLRINAGTKARFPQLAEDIQVTPEEFGETMHNLVVEISRQTFVE